MSSLADLSASVHKASPTVDHSTYQYHIKLQLGSASWEVTKRFSEFDTLLQSLGNSRYAGLPRVPAKTLWGSPTDNAAIDARKEQLRIILQDLLLRPDTRTSQQVRTFLSIDSHIDDGAIRTLQPEPLRTFEDPRFGVSGICVAPEANLLLVTHEDSTHLSRLGRVWSVVEPDELGALHLWAKHSDGSWKRSYSQTFGIKVRSLAWESLSRQFFVGLEDGKIQVYAFAEGSTQPDVTCTLELHHKSPVTHLSVSTRKLLSLGLDTAMRVIDVHSRELVCGGRLLKRLRSVRDVDPRIHSQQQQPTTNNNNNQQPTTTTTSNNNNNNQQQQKQLQQQQQPTTTTTTTTTTAHKTCLQREHQAEGAIRIVVVVVAVVVVIIVAVAIVVVVGGGVAVVVGGVVVGVGVGVVVVTHPVEL
ncbi:unnamed protein product, partial [Polarella glacialis]